jgi:hypothetical protein
LAASCVAAAQVAKKDLPAYLAGVTERGRALYAYDQAAWHGTDAFFELHPNTTGLTHYICTKGSKGWVVTFPKWNTLHTQLQVVYEAMETEKPGVYTARKIDPPWEAPDTLVAQERALELGIASFHAEHRSYNAAILPAPAGNLYVYIYPAQVKTGVWPIGGDVRYTISRDGKQILETRQLHKTILDMEFPEDKQIVAGMHSHVLSDVVEDTDVLYVLTRRPSMPEYIGAGKWIFIVAPDGSIQITKK